MIAPQAPHQQPEFRLLAEFRLVFEGHVYKHQVPNQGEFVAVQLYEDLVFINRSSRYTDAVLNRNDHVLNLQKRRRGIRARRGDATFGEIVPGEVPMRETGYLVPRGPTASVEIDVELKVLAKAMIKQRHRVKNDLRNQVAQFRCARGNPICIAVVGINRADMCISYEAERPFPTTGRGEYRHPAQEAAEAERRLIVDLAHLFDEFLILRYRATNAAPFAFEWVDYNATRLAYAAALSRISNRYQQRF